MPIPREDGTTKLGLNEKLSVKGAGGGVEGCSRDGGVNVIGSSYGVAGAQLSDLVKFDGALK